MLTSTFVCLVFLIGGEEDKPAPKKDNGPCLVCHLDLSSEKIAVVHEEENVYCVSCHGPSTHHMHDEMLMTKPDILFGRNEVEDFCQECHESHENPDKVKRFLRKWYGRDRPNGRLINEHSICTDCHGRHNIVKESPKPKDGEPSEEWLELFDGESLSSWDGSPEAWTVKRRRIRASPPVGQTTNLKRPVSLDGFRLYVTFRLTGKQEAAFVWKEKTVGKILLADGSQPAGSMLVDEKVRVLNPDREALDPEGWNTLSLSAGEHLEVWLNGKDIYRVRRAEASKTTEVGFAVRSREEGATLEVGEIKVQKAQGAKEKQ